MGPLDLAFLPFKGSGEGAFLEAEEFAFKKIFRHSRTVERDVRAGTSRAVAVDRASDQLFSRSAFSQNEHGGVRGGDLTDEFEDLLERTARAHQWMGPLARIG